ncbi:MAG: response regulator [Armatimonadota bacterium]|jgi:DNA-binding response OmpR family regulator
MRVLIAEDDAMYRRLLRRTLAKWGYEVVVATDGIEACELLRAADRPHLAILDWMMPGMDGPEVCRRVREAADPQPTYIILLTAKDSADDIVSGLQAGADDYIAKPANREELRVRVQVGARLVELQLSLADRVRELEDALSQVKQLRGLLPICSYCKRIRDDRNYWQQVDSYIATHTEAQFTHGICPDCIEDTVKPMFEEHTARRKGGS